MKQKHFDPEAFLRSGTVLAARIARRQSTIDWLRGTVGGPCASDPSRMRISGGKHSGGESDRVGRFLDLEEEQKQDLRKMKQIGEAVQRELESISDLQTFRVVMLRAFEELNWPQIGERLKVDPRTARSKYRNYLKSISAPDLPGCEDLFYRWNDSDPDE